MQVFDVCRLHPPPELAVVRGIFAGEQTRNKIALYLRIGSRPLEWGIAATTARDTRQAGGQRTCTGQPGSVRRNPASGRHMRP